MKVRSGASLLQTPLVCLTAWAYARVTALTTCLQARRPLQRCPPKPHAAHCKPSQPQLCGARTNGPTDAQVYDTTARQIVASTLDGAARPHLSQ